MNAKKLITAMTMVAMVTLVASADVHHDVTTKVTYFDYSPYTYTYLDDNGVEQTASITDEATSAKQIIALLEKVYTDKTIPGIRYAYAFKDADGNPYQRKKLNYEFNANRGTPWTKTGVIDNPDEDGMTMLLVQVKDDFRSTHAAGKTPEQIIDIAFQSVKLVKNFTRVNDENNPGYLLSVDGISTNRFYFISKGKPRATYTKPLYMTYEQISPVNYGEGGQATDNFIDEIKAGHAYYCHHDCTEMLTLQSGHWFTINKSGENYSLNNLSIFLPDRRFEKNLNPNVNASDTDPSSSVYKNYGRNGDDTSPDWDPIIVPKVLMYTATLDAKAEPAEVKDHYKITLDWGTSFTQENLGVDVPQHFYVYLVDGNNRVRLVSVEDQPTQARTHSYLVEQTEEMQEFSYIVTAHPINYDSEGNMLLNEDGTPYITISAESPVRTVTVPPLSIPFFIQALEYRSRYEIQGESNQYNVYKNTMSIHPMEADDYSHIEDETYNVTRTDDAGNKAVVASVHFAPIQSGGFHYVITYNDESQNTETTFDQEPLPSTEGDVMSFENSTIYVVDRFLASTRYNRQSASYLYRFEKDDHSRSNDFLVPVFKTTNDVSGSGRTLEEVIADVDHSAKATPDNTITFSAINNPAANLVEYEVRRLSQKNFKEYTKVGKAENYQNSGQYYIYALNSKGQLNELVGTESISTEGGLITAYDVNSSTNNRISSYVPVINTNFNGDVSKPNSYGCDIKRVRYPQVELAPKKTMKTKPFYGNGGDLMGYLVNLEIQPVLPLASESDINYVYYYRLWRVIDGKSAPTRFEEEVLLNREDHDAGYDDNGNVQWEKDYDCLYLTYPDYGSDQVNYWPVNDIFIDWAFDGSKMVKYIVRLYATVLSPTQQGEIDHHTMSVDGSGRDYFIAENNITVTFDNQTTTAIGTIDSDSNSNVEGVTYYNMMGVASNRPYEGMNIVVTRYSDGSTTTEKVIK